VPAWLPSAWLSPSPLSLSLSPVRRRAMRRQTASQSPQVRYAGIAWFIIALCFCSMGEQQWQPGWIA